MRPDLSACLIVKNEEHWISGCLESLRRVADEIVVADTGSTDRTVELVEPFPAKRISIPWTDDFSAARNRCLEEATGHWILSIDADERIDARGARLIRKMLGTQVEGVFVTIRCPAVAGHTPFVETGRQCRLFRNDPRFRFRGRIHEQVVESILAAGGAIADSEIVIDHLGYATDAETLRGKWERNLALLQRHVDDDPGDLRRVYLLGRQYILLGRHKEGRALLERCLAEENNPARLVPVWNDLAMLLANLPDSWPEAVSLAEKSLAQDPAQTVPLFIRANAYRTGRRDAQAAAALLSYWRGACLSAGGTAPSADVAIDRAKIGHDLLDLLPPDETREEFRAAALRDLLQHLPAGDRKGLEAAIRRGSPELLSAARSAGGLSPSLKILLLRLALPENELPAALSPLLDPPPDGRPTGLDLPALSALALFFLRAHKLMFAKRAVQAFAEHPDSRGGPESVMALATELERLASPGLSRHLLESAIARFPADASLRKRLVASLLEARLFPAALRQLEEAIGAFPEDEELLSIHNALCKKQ